MTVAYERHHHEHQGPGHQAGFNSLLYGIQITDIFDRYSPLRSDDHQHDPEVKTSTSQGCHRGLGGMIKTNIGRYIDYTAIDLFAVAKPSKIKRCTLRCSAASIIKRLIALVILVGVCLGLLYLLQYLYPMWYTLTWVKSCEGCFKRDHFTYTINPEGICSSTSTGRTCDTDIDVIVLLMSRPGGRERREAIRGTWLSITKGNSHPSLRHVFIVGKPDNTTEQIMVEEEANKYGDVVQQDFREHYDNLTLKTQAGLEWASTYCHRAKYIIKSDEDMYVNVTKILDFSVQHPDIDNFVLGRRRITINSVMNYPPYVEGGRYFMSMKIAQAILAVSANTPFFKAEDVFNGICLWKTPFSIWPFWGIETAVSLEEEISCEDLSEIYSIHNAGVWNRVNPQDLINTWNRCYTKHYYS